MTIGSERTRAVLNTRKFLLDLLDPKKTPSVPKAIRKRAAACLRHYPGEFDMYMLISGDNERFGNVEGLTGIIEE